MERKNSPAKSFSFSEEPVFPKGLDGLRSDGIWSQQNFLSLNLSVNGQVGGMGALIKLLRPTVSSRNTSCSICPRCIPWLPCSGIVSIWQPLPAVWNECWERTDPLGIAHPRISVGPTLLSFISTSTKSLGKKGLLIARWLFAGSLHFCLLVGVRTKEKRRSTQRTCP